MLQPVACQCRELCKHQEEGGKLVSRVRGLTESRNPAVMVQPRPSLLHMEKLKSQAVTWQTSQGGAALESSPPDIIDSFRM